MFILDEEINSCSSEDNDDIFKDPSFSLSSIKDQLGNFHRYCVCTLNTIILIYIIDVYLLTYHTYFLLNYFIISFCISLKYLLGYNKFCLKIYFFHTN